LENWIVAAALKAATISKDVERATRKCPNLGLNLNERTASPAYFPAPMLDDRSAQPGDLILRIVGETPGGRAVGPSSVCPPKSWVRTSGSGFWSGGEERNWQITAGSIHLVKRRIPDSKSPTPEQLKIRESWLKR